MEPITLNAEQEVRLLEMCNTFLPQYKHKILKTERGQIHIDYSDFQPEIPWLEFMMLHLFGRMYQSFNSRHLAEVYNSIYRYANRYHTNSTFRIVHPVDTFYSQFEHIKNNAFHIEYRVDGNIMGIARSYDGMSFRIGDPIEFREGTNKTIGKIDKLWESNGQLRADVDNMSVVLAVNGEFRHDIRTPKYDYLKDK